MTTLGQAVIVGAGLTGMAISKTLSDASVPHLLLGRAPDGLPRLGESLNLEGTLLLEQFCGGLEHTFSPKATSVAYMGDHVLSCDFEIARKRANRAFFRLLGATAPSEFLHLDRLALDTAMWDRTAASPWCTIRDTTVTALEQDEPGGRITSIELADGTGLRPRYVFDASNHKRVVAQRVGVPVRLLGAPQRVAFTHFHPAEPGDGRRPATDYSTNLVRLLPDVDGINAMAWYIPLPGYLSVGVSTDDTSTDLTDDDLLTKVEEAYARRGLHYRDRFPKPAPVMGLRHRYYAHERAYGPNWVLAGGTFASVWWLSGAGVGTSFVAGQMAAELLHDPEGAGRVYQRRMENLVPIHDTFDWFVYAGRREMTKAALLRNSDGFVRTNVSRLAATSRLRGGLVARAAGAVLDRMIDRHLLLRHYCDVLPAELSTQTSRMFGPDLDDDEAAVLRLSEVIAGRAPLEEASHLLAPDVVSHLDGLTARGSRVWRDWVTFLRSRPGRPHLDLVDLRTHLLADGRVVLVGRWRLGPTVSDPVSATYRFERGRIAEIWTSRSNYAFVLGAWCRSALAMALVAARVGAASRIRAWRST